MSDNFEKDLMDEYMSNQKPEETKEEPKQEEQVISEENKKDVHTDNEIQTEEPKGEEPKEEPKPEDTPKEFDIEAFNKAIESEEPYESVDQLKELLSLAKGSSELKAKFDDQAKLIEEKDAAIQEGFNPMTYFANEQQFKINQILKANEGLNENIVNRVVTSNLDEMSDEDVLILNDLIDTKGTYDEKIVRLDIKDRYGLNVIKEDLDDDEIQAYQVKEYRLKKDAERARNDLRKITDIELPTFQDPKDIAEARKAEQEKAFNERKENWNKFTEDYVEKLDKLIIPYKDDENKDVVVDFAIDDKFKEMLKTNLPQYATLLGKDVNNKAHLKEITELVQKDYLWLHKGDIIKSVTNDIVTKMTKEQFDKYQNTSKPKQVEAPKNLSDEERHNSEEYKRMLNDFGIK